MLSYPKATLYYDSLELYILVPGYGLSLPSATSDTFWE